jgi:hypothetical protein
MDSTAITLEDFTALAEGTTDGSGARVRQCPRCGRNGLKVHEASGDSYLHIQTSRAFPDGILTETQDCCSEIEN